MDLGATTLRRLAYAAALAAHYRVAEDLSYRDVLYQAR